MVVENNNPPAGTDPAKNQEPNPNPTTTPAETTFTQAELDAKIEERLARERKKFPSKEDMTAFNAWKATQKPEPEPTPAPVDNTELIRAKSELELFKLNAQPEFMEFLVAKLSVMEGDDIKKNAETVKASNPQYFQQAQQRRVASSPRLSGGASAPKTTNETMNNILRGVK